MSFLSVPWPLVGAYRVMFGFRIYRQAFRYGTEFHAAPSPNRWENKRYAYSHRQNLCIKWNESVPCEWILWTNVVEPISYSLPSFFEANSFAGVPRLVVVTVLCPHNTGRGAWDSQNPTIHTSLTVSLCGCDALTIIMQLCGKNVYMFLFNGAINLG